MVGINSIVALRLLGVAPGIPLAPTVKLFPTMYIGFWINAVSGLLLLSANATGMLTMLIFFIKIGFIVLAILALRLTRNQVFGDPAVLESGVVTPRAKQLAIASLVCWTFAIIAGRLTAYPYFVEAWFGI